MSDDEETPLDPSDPETQFIPQEDDDETLWEVIEITAERGREYKVRWKGVDPKTKKPWPQSWVAKHDCTDDLVQQWKLRQARNRKGEHGVSRASGSTTKAYSPKSNNVYSTRRSSSTTTAVTPRRGRSMASVPSSSVHQKSTRSRWPVEMSSPSPPASLSLSPTGLVDDNSVIASSISARTGTKRKHGETTSTTTSARLPASSPFYTTGVERLSETNSISGSVPPPRKRRKLEVEIVNSHKHFASPEVDDMVRKRKGRSRAIESDHDNDDYVEVKTESDEIAEQGSEHSDLQRRNLTSPSQSGTEKKEGEERMIEESLSDIYYNSRPQSLPEPSYDQEEEGTPVPPVRVQTPTQRRQETAEESTPRVSQPQREMEKKTDSLPADLARTTSKLNPPSKKSMRSSASSSSSSAAVKPTVSITTTEESHTTTKYLILSQAVKFKTATGANKRKKVTVSKQQWEELNDFQSQQVTEPEMVLGHDKSTSQEDPHLDMNLDCPVVEELPPPPAKSVPDQTAELVRSDSLPRSGKESIPFSISRSKGVGSPGPSAAPSTGIVSPTTPHRNENNGTNDEEDSHKSPILSPGARKRLVRFDRAVKKIELKSGHGKEKEKERQPEDGAILGKVKKRKKREEEKDGEMAVTGGSGRQEQEVLRTSEKRQKGKEKAPDQVQGASRAQNQEHGKGKSTSKSELAYPVLQSYDSDANPLARLKHQEGAEAKRQESKQLNQRSSSHHASDSEVEPIVKSDANARTESKGKTKDMPLHKPTSRFRSRLTDTEEAEEKEDNSSSTRVGTANTKLEEREIFNATSKPVSKPQSEVGTNTTQTRPPPSTTVTVRQSANPRSNSFVDDDIIPETEESQSQSQEIDLQGPIASHLLVLPATPSFVNMKPTSKSRMKPKLDMEVGVGTDEDLEDGPDNASGTEGAVVKKISHKKANENGTTTTKPFGPIPRISPSAFTAHLPSSLPESIIESAEGDGDDVVKRVTDRNEDDDSIEQFESPMKRIGSGLGGERRIGILNAVNRQEKEKQQAKESASDLWNSDLNRRGRELAEGARKREKERLRAEEQSSHPASVLTKLIPRAKNAPFGNFVKGGSDCLPGLQEEEINPDVSTQSLPPQISVVDAYVDSGGISEGQRAATAANAVAGASTGIEGSQSVEAELTVDSNDIEMGAAGIVEQQLDPIYLRQEEEESTQDLMMELRLHQQRQGFEVGWSGDLVPEIRDDTVNLPPAIQIDSQPIIEAMLDEGAQKQKRESDLAGDEIPNILDEKPSQAPSARSHSSLESEDGLSRQRAKSRTSKSRSPSRSFSSQKGEIEMEPDAEAEVPATASTHRESFQAPSQPADSQAENVEEEDPHHLGAAMHLLNAKSEEISKLEGQLSAEQRTNEDLLQQLSAFRLDPTESTNVAQSATRTLEQELAEARSQLALQTACWEKERASLALSIETATRGKASAEQDRDFFREQYAKASAFVSSVRDENVELEKRIKIATDQAQSGVSLIKTTFELRTKSLEEDVRAWRRMAEFLIEKDRRTNDDIRRRAAEEPELRARCDRQEGALEESTERLVELEVKLEQNQRMFVEAAEAGKRWKEATVTLNLELNEAKTKLERIGKVGIGDDGDPNGHEFVYRCQWRPDDSIDGCEALFLNLSELQEHMYAGGHIQRH